MYGTIAHMRIKPGALQALKEMEDRKPKGFVGSYVYQMDNDPKEIMLTVLFEDKESYFENAKSPEQDREYRHLRSLLERDPEWHDGEIIYSIEPLRAPC